MNGHASFDPFARLWVLVAILAPLGCESEAGTPKPSMAMDAGETPAPVLDASREPIERDARAEAGPVTLPSLCSGCSTEALDPSVTKPRVHHVHLNVRDAAETIAFYEKYFEAEPVRLNDVATVLWAEPILLLLDEVDSALSDTLHVGFEHVGMGVKDPAAWFEQASAQGVMADDRNGAPKSPVAFSIEPGSTPYFESSTDVFAYIYVRGPNHERIEVWSGWSMFRHAHFMTPDIDATVAWYAALLGVEPYLPMADPMSLLPNNLIDLDGMQLGFFSPMTSYEFVETDREPVGHIAFSVQDLDALFARAMSSDLPVVSEPAQTEFGFRSFFVRGPDKVLIELVEAGPLTAP